MLQIFQQDVSCKGPKPGKHASTLYVTFRLAVKAGCSCFKICEAHGQERLSLIRAQSGPVGLGARKLSIYILNTAPLLSRRPVIFLAKTLFIRKSAWSFQPILSGTTVGLTTSNLRDTLSMGGANNPLHITCMRLLALASLQHTRHSSSSQIHAPQSCGSMTWTQLGRTINT